MSEAESETSDIFDLELQLQEKFNELQWKSKALEEAQNELTQVRQKLLTKELDLEDKRHVIGDLRTQLTTANQVIEWIDKEKSKLGNERIQLQINCDAAVKERESLLEQAHAVRLENMTLKLNVQKLKDNLAVSEAARKVLETGLAEMQERFSQTHNCLQSNVAKLEKEHQLLLKSVESTKQLNRRLQTVGLCFHAIYTKKNNEIKELREELALKQGTVSKPTEMNFATSQKKNKFDEKEFLEQIRVDIEKWDEVDKEIEAFLLEFQND